MHRRRPTPHARAAAHPTITHPCALLRRAPSPLPMEPTQQRDVSRRPSLPPTPPRPPHTSGRRPAASAGQPITALSAPRAGPHSAPSPLPMEQTPRQRAVSRGPSLPLTPTHPRPRPRQPHTSGRRPAAPAGQLTTALSSASPASPRRCPPEHRSWCTVPLTTCILYISPVNPVQLLVF